MSKENNTTSVSRSLGSIWSAVKKAGNDVKEAAALELGALKDQAAAKTTATIEEIIEVSALAALEEARKSGKYTDEQLSAIYEAHKESHTFAPLLKKPGSIEVGDTGPKGPQDGVQ
jgi:hypothetical protein